MGRKYKQFRFYGASNEMNEPKGFDGNNLNELTNENGKPYFPIYKLGIQTFPGFKFYINEDKNNENQGIIINNTGIFELDLKDKITINSLRFDPKSLGIIEKKDTGDDQSSNNQEDDTDDDQSSNNRLNAYLLIDIIYEEE